MKQKICNIIHDAIKKYNPAIFTPWKDLGCKDFDDLLNKIKTDFQVAIWALTELEHYSDWEHNFVVDTTNDEYEIPIYKVGDITFMVKCPPYDGDYIITPLKYTTKTIVKHVWEVDNSIKI
jgi:hypothetical protein